MVKKTLKNILKIKFPLYKIPPGKTMTLDLKEDDIHFRGIELGHLKIVKRKPKKVIKAKVKKKVKYS